MPGTKETVEETPANEVNSGRAVYTFEGTGIWVA